MIHKKDLNYFRSKGLLPFQAEVAIKFLESKDKPYWQFVSPVGTGKIHVAAVIASELVVESKKRMLVLAPAPLLGQWHFELSRTAPTYTSMIVDRKTYLEMESRVSVGENPWPPAAVILMSIDLAKRDDMAKNLSGTTWDFAVFDESHLLTGKRKTLFERLTSSGAIRRGLLLTCTESSVLSGVETMIVKPSDVVDWNRKPLYSPTKRKVRQLSYNRTEEELVFLKQLHDFATQLSDQWSYGKLQSNIILQAGLSSTYTAEVILRRLQDAWRPIRNKFAHGVPLASEDIEKTQKQIGAFADELEVDQEPTDSTEIRPQNFLTLYQKLEMLLDQVEEISADSKLDALINRLRLYLDFEVEGNPYFCICSSFANTIRYLSSSLSTQDVETKISALTAALEPSYRRDILQEFREKGGILIATDIALEGAALEYVDECISYDLPLNPNVFEQRWVRFLRVGRKSEFRMVILKDQSKALPWEEELSKVLENTMACNEESN